MTPEQVADMLDAGRKAIPEHGGTAAQVLDAVLTAMARSALEAGYLARPPRLTGLDLDIAGLRGPGTVLSAVPDPDAS